MSKDIADGLIEARKYILWLEAECLALKRRVILAEQHESKAWQAGWDNCSRLRRDPDKRFDYADWKRGQQILDYSTTEENHEK